MHCTTRTFAPYESLKAFENSKSLPRAFRTGSYAGSFHSCFADELSTVREGAPRLTDAISLFEQPLQPVQVALHKSGIGGELRIRHVGLAKESKNQLAATAVGD
jgi:hypothetical protein